MKIIKKKEKLEIKKDYEKINWEEVIPVLMAYSLSHLGDKKFSNTKSKLAYDFTMDTILKYLEDTSKFDPKRNPDLIKYLKYNILRQIIYNFKKSAGVRKRIKINESDNDDKGIYSLENLYYEKGKYIEDKVDLGFVLTRVKKKLENKNDLKQIFDLFYLKNSKRKEVCDDLKISLQEFDNRSRRLKRIFDNEIKSFF